LESRVGRNSNGRPGRLRDLVEDWFALDAVMLAPGTLACTLAPAERNSDRGNAD
jgi:hypothetical protein